MERWTQTSTSRYFKITSFPSSTPSLQTADVIFQQDNTTPHISKRTRLWFENTMHDHGFFLMEWRPNSPDMNPIENLWAHLELELHWQYPDTKSLRGSRDAIKRVLRTWLTEVWWDIGEEVLNRLLDSIPHRVQALLAVECWYTKYWKIYNYTMHH